MFSRKKISIFGVTGSVGRAAQDIILGNHECFEVETVTAGQNARTLSEAALRLKARRAVIANSAHYEDLKDYLQGSGIEVLAGEKELEAAAGHKVDIILAASVGFSGLRPILKALSSGINVAIANKEPLVAAGALVMETAQKAGATVIPVDSEHNAIFQVFDAAQRKKIEKIILTASGGPFRLWEKARIDTARIEEALNHPNWAMGPKISIDSASMMNKALEVIEAHHLFNMPPEKIEVVIHPQSIIHGMVQYVDGSVLSQMGPSDMRVPIAHALGWPERLTQNVSLDISKLSELTFEKPDYVKFLALKMAYDCLRSGHAACVALNAANEVAVEAFLEGRIDFGRIVHCVRQVLDQKLAKSLKTVEEIEEFDTMCRAYALEKIKL